MAKKKRKERVDTPEKTLSYLGRVVAGEVPAIDLIGRSFSGFANRREVVAGGVKSATVESGAIGINSESDLSLIYMHGEGMVLMARKHDKDLPKKNKRRGGKKRRKGEPEQILLENFILE